MKSSLVCTVVLVLSGLLTCCGDTQTSCPNCPLSVTVGPNVAPTVTATPTPKPTPTPSVQPAIPVPTPTPSPAMQCVGTPVTCESLTDKVSCGRATGCAFIPDGCTSYICTDIDDQLTCAKANCNWDVVCTGFSASCYSISDSISCGRQQGCQWINQACVGGGLSCRDIHDYTGCNNQQGCGVASACTNISVVSTQCGQTSNVNECNYTTGCYYATAHCAGKLEACENLDNAEFCKANPGCTWQPKP